MMGKIKIGIVTWMLAIACTSVSAQTCGMPDVLTFGNIPGVSNVEVYWLPVAGATSYNVAFRQRNVGAAYCTPLATTAATLTLTNLVPGTDYEFIVQSVCGTDTSTYSPSGWFTSPLPGSAATVTRGPYMTGATSHSINIQWKTDFNCNSEIRYGTSPTDLTTYISAPNLTTSHDIQLTNLQPNTKYYYSVGVVGTALQGTASNYFYTAPADNDTVPTRFWVTGDFGTGTSAQRAVRDAFAGYTSGQKINGWLWLGDNAYTNGLDQEYQTNVFNVYPSQLKNIPLFPALGNHDYGQSGYQSSASLGTNFPYFSIFDIPSTSGTEKYYSANYGNVHLIALDSYGSYNAVNSAMYNWLEADLSNNNKQWTIVYFHHPPYSKGSHDSDVSTELVDMRNNIIPLLESNGVDLVLSGHSHAYERSYFLKGHFGNESSFNASYQVQPGGGPYSKSSRTGNGTVYVVCGVSGQTSATTPGYPHNAMYFSTVNELGSLILDISGTSLTSRFLTSNGTIGDEFTIYKPAQFVNSAGTGIAAGDKAGFSIYPNPANDEINIQTTGFNTKVITVNLYNVFGQTICTKVFDTAEGNKTLHLNRNDLNPCSPGIYYVTLTGENGTVTRPLVIE
jgi:hypothetical protein